MKLFRMVMVAKLNFSVSSNLTRPLELESLPPTFFTETESNVYKINYLTFLFVISINSKLPIPVHPRHLLENKIEKNISHE